MTSIAQRLQTLGIELPAARKPAFSYSAVVIDDGLAWISGQLPWLDDSTELIHKGRLGEQVTIVEAKSCARACVLNGLSVLQQAIGNLDHIQRVIKLVGYVASEKDFHEQPAVIDAGSNLLIEIFGDSGTHARSAIGVAELPRGAPVEIDLVVRVNT